MQKSCVLERSTVQWSVVKRFSINGKASEDREESMQEVKAHCERCYDCSPESWSGRQVEITIDRVLRARGKMMKNKATGPSD